MHLLKEKKTEHSGTIWDSQEASSASGNVSQQPLTYNLYKNNMPGSLAVCCVLKQAVALSPLLFNFV